MAIAHYKPTAPALAPSKPTPAMPDNYKGNVFDNRNVPLTGLIAYVTGAPWSVTYYRQLLSHDSDVKELDDTLDSTYQSYEKIIGLELRVESELTSSTTTDTQQTTVNGSALVVPFITPNKNDYFVTETSLGKKALFLIRKAERKTFQEQAVHSIEYILVQYLQDTDSLYISLTSKTARTLYFSKDRLIQGLSPLLKTETFEEIQSLETTYTKTAAYYFNTFFNMRCYTITLPGQLDLIYDPFLTNALLSIVSVSDSPILRRMKRYPTDEDIYIAQPQIWDALLKRDAGILKYCNRFMGATRVNNFEYNGFIKDAFHGVVDRLVYPIVVDQTALSGPKPAVLLSTTEPLMPTTNYQGGQLGLDENIYPLLNTAVTVYPEIDFGQTYLFTPALYDNIGDKSLLEIVVSDYIHRRTVDLKQLTHLVSLYSRINRMQQFYYGPVLLLLIKSSIMAQY